VNLISIAVLVGFNLVNAALINVRYGNGGELMQSQVNNLVWVLMALCCVSGGGLHIGLVDPLTTGHDVRFHYLVPGLVGFVGVLGVVLFMHFSLPTQCDMSDPDVFKAFGVPFVPATAMFFNFFIMSQFEFKDFCAFLAFVAVLLLGYLVYVRGKSDQTESENPNEVTAEAGTCKA